jgi:hypothetical protein
MHNFTQEDLLQYLYRETSPAKTAAINAALETDWNFSEKFEELSIAKKLLKPLQLSPNNRTINSILAYAEKAINELSATV